MINPPFKIEPTTYRADEFNHPDSRVYNFRYKISLSVPDSEEPEEFNTWESHFTCYTEFHAPPDDDGVMQILKHACFTVFQIWKSANRHQNMEQAGMEIRDITVGELQQFIRYLDPERVSFNLDELELLEEYTYQYYSAVKFLETLRNHYLFGNLMPFDTDEELLDWTQS